jgi:hypothetical protein
VGLAGVGAEGGGLALPRRGRVEKKIIRESFKRAAVGLLCVVGGGGGWRVALESRPGKSS